VARSYRGVGLVLALLCFAQDLGFLCLHCVHESCFKEGCDACGKVFRETNLDGHRM